MLKDMEFEKVTARAFEYQGFVRDPDIIECPSLNFHFPIRFNIYPTRPSGENVDPGRFQKIPSWVPLEVVPIFPLISWEVCIELRVLAETEPFFVFETSKIPKNFFKTGIFAECL